MDILWTFKFHGDESLYRQLYKKVCRAVESGSLKPGDRLPSVADLAKRLKVSKVTVVKAFALLERQGMVSSQVGRGTFISEAHAASPKPQVARSIRKFRESYARGLRELLALNRPSKTMNLSAGVPPLDLVSDGTLERLTQAAFARGTRRLYEYSVSGLAELREAIAGRYGVAADQVVITTGSQQAFGLLACWALDQGLPVACETPTFTGVPGAFSMIGHSVESVPWGEPPAARALLYVCPDFHNPTGQTLTEDARRALGLWADRHDGVVVSDEIFRDLRFTGQAPPSLYSMLPVGRRILVGSLSKTFMTGLRIGFVIADRTVIQDMMPFKRYMDLGGPALTQAVATEFLRNGYEVHLRKAREYYRVRRDATLKALASMPDGVTWTRPEGGFQMWVTLPLGLSSIQLYLLALERGVAIMPGPAHDIDGRFLNCFRICYGHQTPDELKGAVSHLTGAVHQLASRGSVEATPGLGIQI